MYKIKSKFGPVAPTVALFVIPGISLVIIRRRYPALILRNDKVIAA